MKTFFTRAFAENSTLNIGYLARYTFVPSQLLRDCAKSYLQMILYRQKLFHKNIQFFIVKGFQNIDQPHQLAPSNDHDDTTATTEPTTDSLEQSTMDTSESNGN